MTATGMETETQSISDLADSYGIGSREQGVALQVEANAYIWQYARTTVSKMVGG